MKINGSLFLYWQREQLIVPTSEMFASDGGGHEEELAVHCHSTGLVCRDLLAFFHCR